MAPKFYRWHDSGAPHRLEAHTVSLTGSKDRLPGCYITFVHGWSTALHLEDEWQKRG